MEKSVIRIYRILLMAGILFMILSVFLGKENVTEHVGISNKLVATEKQITEDEREFYLQIEAVDGDHNYISFHSSYQFVWVYQDGELIYSLEAGDTVFGKASGGRWNYVQIGSQTEEVVVRIKDAYPQVRGNEVAFYQGNATGIYKSLTWESVLEFIISNINLTIGIVLLVCYVIAKNKMQIGQEIGYFAIFTILIGLWSLNENEIVKNSTNNRVAISYIGYMLLMLLIVPFVLFVRDFFGLGKEKIAYIICIMSFTNIIVCTTLHMTGILEFKQTAICMHVLLLLGMLYLLYALGRRFKEKGLDRMVRINLLGLVFLIVPLIVDLAAFYSGSTEMDILGKVGVLFYIMLLGNEAVNNMVSKVKAGYKAVVYHELAMKDSLTGLFNRNAYDRWVTKNHKFQGTAIIAFDLNDLKKCNDTLGHEAGDKYIKDASALLAKVYETTGQCYRIGGDEFCVIIENADETWIENSFKELERLEYAYNQTSEVVKMQIAYGYAVFDEKMDVDVENTRDRADMIMYKKKQLKKGILKNNEML